MIMWISITTFSLRGLEINKWQWNRDIITRFQRLLLPKDATSIFDI